MVYEHEHKIRNPTPDIKFSASGTPREAPANLDTTFKSAVLDRIDRGLTLCGLHGNGLRELYLTVWALSDK